MNIDDYRVAIDHIDDRILDLLTERAGYAVKIGEIKSHEKEVAYVPGREMAIFERLDARNKGGFPPKAVHRIFREIISACLALEHPLRVAYLGPQATFTHKATLSQFGGSAHLLPQKSIPAVFEEVESGRANFGVIPIENSNEGAVTHTLDRFMVSDLTIFAESYLNVSHDLMSRTGKLPEVQRVYSHPQAIEQCRRWLKDNCPNATLVETVSTARAAQIVAEEDHAAAIASNVAAEVYDLKPIAQNIEDYFHNYTRFLVIGKSKSKPTGKDKTSIMFSFEDHAGILSRMLEPFRKQGLNLAKIESRPIKRKAWEYVFFLDIEGHIEDGRVRLAVEGLRGLCQDLKILGSYRRAR